MPKAMVVVSVCGNMMFTISPPPPVMLWCLTKHKIGASSQQEDESSYQPGTPPGHHATTPNRLHVACVHYESVHVSFAIHESMRIIFSRTKRNKRQAGLFWFFVGVFTNGCPLRCTCFARHLHRLLFVVCLLFVRWEMLGKVRRPESADLRFPQRTDMVRGKVCCPLNAEGFRSLSWAEKSPRKCLFKKVLNKIGGFNEYGSNTGDLSSRTDAC